MAARQKATRHTLDDGFVIASDSSEVDEALREKLLEAGSFSIDEVVVEMGGIVPPVPIAPRRAAPGRRRPRGSKVPS
jgi:hypothetical protein